MHHHQPEPARFSSSSPAPSACVTPSSSPLFGPVDSSPPSSPGLVPYSLDSPADPGSPFSHPFAASTKAIKRPPNYEKKADSPPCTPPGTFTTRGLAGLTRTAVCSRSLREDDYYLSNGSPSASPPAHHRTSRYLDREERIWDDALREPFDTGIGRIDLSNQQLKSIPPSIGDLAGFFNTPQLSEQCLFSGRMLARVNTEPTTESTRVRSFERTQSIRDSGKERHVLKLYLMSNMISSLPPELFSLKNLTVLSLRSNRLTFIPPDICRLMNLHELNISNNQLTFLPWQMRDMKIEKLLLNPNPFLPEPCSPSPSPSPSPHTSPSRPRTRPRRSIGELDTPFLRNKQVCPADKSKPVLSPVVYSFGRVPPLTELCLRILLAPSGSTTASRGHTVLADLYALPLSDQWRIPSKVQNTLMECVPGVLRPRKRFSADAFALPGAETATGTSTGTCPNPEHKGRVMVRHGSERFSWERRIAGVDVGGAVPVRWRGCLWRCLDFLEGVDVRDSEKEQRRDEDEVDLDPDSDMDMDMDMSMAVQTVDLGGIHLEMDFDD